jgi:hypothetical protein
VHRTNSGTLEQTRVEIIVGSICIGLAALWWYFLFVFCDCNTAISEVVVLLSQ